MSAYTDQSRVEAYLKRTLSAEESVLLQPIIEYVSKIIEVYTNRAWNGCQEDDDDENVIATARLFDGNGECEIYIDDFSDLEKIELLDSQGSVFETIDDEADYLLYPANGTVFDDIYFRGRRFPRGRGNIRVTAKFSSGNVPDGVIVVATAMVCNNLSSSNDNGLKQESIEGYSRTFLTPSDYISQNETLLGNLDIYKKVLL